MISILLREMHQERKWNIKIHLSPSIDARLTQIRLRDLYYDSFTRFLDGLSHAVIKLQRVASTIYDSNTINLSSINEWQTHILQYLCEVQSNCTQIINFDQWLLEKLLAFKLDYSDESKLLNGYDHYDYNIKRCYKFLSRTWLETVALYHMLWFEYEAATISNIMKNHSPITQTISLEKKSDFTLFNNGTIYVDDDYAPGGNGSFDHPFNKIQDAIEAANPYDSIYVFTGTYHEHPVISKPLSLIGENKFHYDYRW